MKTTTFYRFEIDTELWRAFKSKCAAQGKSMVSVIIELIKDFTKK